MPVSVARVQPRTSKGITDLLLPQTSHHFDVICPSKKSNTNTSGIHRPSTKPPNSEELKFLAENNLIHPFRRLVRLFSKLRSRSLSELTRQITPPTKNGHAPPPIESRKSYQSVHPPHVWTWWVFPCWVKLSRRLHSWWCPSVNSFKLQPCDHTPPRTQRLMISHKVLQESFISTSYNPWSASFIVKTTTVSDRLRSLNFRSWSMEMSLVDAFAPVHLPKIQEFHLWQRNMNTPVYSYWSLQEPSKPTK